uniref:Uncharacterized protein n=2 Tax=Cannabis sativa TaxID=3483 RepID=A0A803NVQ7_CANSA
MEAHGDDHGGGEVWSEISVSISDDKSFSTSTDQPPLPLVKLENTTSQIAIVGSNLYSIESLDYEIVENELFKHDLRSKKKVKIFQYVLIKWTFALLIGLGTGLVGFLNNIAVENISDFKLLLTTDLMSKKQ